ncbi:DNA repair protein RadA, partial [Candidatus Aerophobetes bacterium]
MVKKSRFVCKVCGYTTYKWIGRCPECGEWDCLVEEIVEERESRSSTSSLPSSPPQIVNEIP